MGVNRELQMESIAGHEILVGAYGLRRYERLQNSSQFRLLISPEFSDWVARQHSYL